MNADEEIMEYADRMVEHLKNTDQYRDYIHAMKVLNTMPDVKERVYEFRRENYFLQHAPEGEDIYSRVAQLREKNDELLQMPEVEDFLMTEWELFSMIQHIFDRMMDQMEF